MKQFVNFALVLFASVAAVQCGSYGAIPPPTPAASYGGGAPSYGGPAVQQVSLASLGNLANLANSYLDGASSGSSYGSAPSYSPAKYVVAPSAPAPGPVSSSGYSAAPSASYGAAPSASYDAAPSAGYAAAPSAGYGAAPSAGYGAAAGGYGSGAAPKFSVLPAWVSQIHPGKLNYKSYQSPIQYSTVALPIVPSEPVAKLFVPEHSGSSYGSSGNSYGAPSISIGSGY